MRDGQIVRFKFSEAFPADDQLARWMTVCAMALNDLLIVNLLLVPRLEEKIPAAPGENFYLGRVGAAHLFEAATFLRKSDRIPAIKEFVTGLDDEVQDAYGELLEIGEGGQGKFYEQLKHARNKSFHYQELFQGDHEEREPLKRAMAEHAADEQEKPDKRGEITDIPPAITGFRANFAYDVASEMLLPENTDAEYPDFVAETANHIAKFAGFAKAALNAYTQTRAAGFWEIEEIEGGADFLELLTRLQGLVNQDLRVEILMDDRFLGLSFHAEIERVETLPDSEAVIVHFSNGVSLDLAPGEQRIQVTEHGLELRASSGVTVVLSAEGEA